jgi:anti-sigma B factor antagonist
MKPQTLTQAPLALTLTPPSHNSLAGKAAVRPSLGIEVRMEGSRTVVKLTGSAEMTQADPLRDRIETLAKEAASVIVLDLSEVDFIGSACLAAIVHGYLTARDRHRDVRLAAPQPRVLEVLRRARLTRLFPVYDSAAEALAT